MCLSPSQVLDSVSSSGYILSDHGMSLGVFFWAGAVGGCWIFPGKVEWGCGLTLGSVPGVSHCLNWPLHSGLEEACETPHSCKGAL